MNALHTPGRTLMARATVACKEAAEGPVTPIVIEPYGPLIGGERGFCLGYMATTESGSGCIVWTHRATIAKAVAR